MKDKRGTVIYVGKSKKLKNRVRSYFAGANDQKTQRLVHELADFEYVVTSSEIEALILEMNLIKKNIKPYLATFLYISILSTSLVSCSGDDLGDIEILERNNELVKKSPDTVDIDRIKEMVTPFPINDV